MFEIIGIWSERGQLWIRPELIQDSLSPGFSESVMAYLAEGQIVNDGVAGGGYYGYTPKDAEWNRWPLRTDGHYCWPSGLIDVIRQFRVSLPKDFLRNVRAGSIISGKVYDRLFEGFSSELWELFCKENGGSGLTTLNIDQINVMTKLEIVQLCIGNEELRSSIKSWLNKEVTNGEERVTLALSDISRLEQADKK